MYSYLFTILIMINTWSNVSQENIEKYTTMMQEDSISEEVYKEIYLMIPETFLVEKDRDLKGMFGFKIKTTKWKFNKIKDKDMIDKLKKFAEEKKFWLGNQLAFNDHFDDMFVRTIYLIKN